MKQGVKGHLENVGLAAFVQLLEIEKETCILTVRHAARTGTLFFWNGELRNAEVGEARGEEAAIRILDWEIADVDMTGASQDEPPPHSIRRPLTFLLIEAMRRRDERGRFAIAGGGTGAAGADSGEPAAVPVEALLRALVADVEGLVAAAIIDPCHAAALASLSERAGFDVALVAPFCCELLRNEEGLLAALGVDSTLDDVALTFGDQIHLILRPRSGHLVYVVVDRARTSFPALRAGLQRRWHLVDALPAAGAAGAGSAAAAASAARTVGAPGKSASARQA